MKACGISLYRAAVSVAPAVAGVQRRSCSGSSSRVLAKANRRADVLDAQIRGRAPRLFDIMNRQWVVGHDGSIYHYSYYNPERDEMTGLVIYRPDQRTWTLSSATFAERVSWKHGLAGASGWEQDFKSNPPTWTPFTQPDARGAGDARLLQDRAAGGRHDDRRPAPALRRRALAERRQRDPAQGRSPQEARLPARHLRDDAAGGAVRGQHRHAAARSTASAWAS